MAARIKESESVHRLSLSTLGRRDAGSAASAGAARPSPRLSLTAPLSLSLSLAPTTAQQQLRSLAALPCLALTLALFLLLMPMHLRQLRSRLAPHARAPRVLSSAEERVSEGEGKPVALPQQDISLVARQRACLQSRRMLPSTTTPLPPPPPSLICCCSCRSCRLSQRASSSTDPSTGNGWWMTREAVQDERRELICAPDP